MLTRVVWRPNLTLPPENRAVALGVFDGVHRGHAAVIAATAAPGLVPCVVQLCGVPKREAYSLCSAAQEQRALEALGVREQIEVPFAAIRDMQADEFIQKVLFNSINTKRAVCGFNFHFGKGAAATAADLCALVRAGGRDACEVGAVYEGGEVISSSRIRRLIESGEPAAAAVLLGRPFAVEGEVVGGQHLARTFQMPTINQPLPVGLVRPRFGVYAARVRWDGRVAGGVTNIGIRPTVGADGPLAETWIRDFDGDLYGKTVTVELLHFIRPEQRFPSLDALQSQMKKDAAEAAQYR